MRRWNGWGDDAVALTLAPDALRWLHERIGPGRPSPDASLETLLAALPASRLSAPLSSPLPDQPRIDPGARARLAVAMGESYRDWICKRFGVLPAAPDGVAHPENSADVRALLNLAHERGWIVIPFGGGTRVAGHLDTPIGERPVLSLNLGRMSRLLHLDPVSRIARFGAGAPGPLIESQLRAHGVMLGHFPQSFEYSTLGGWVVTRSSGQQSLRYGRIEQIFAGGRFEAPIGTLELPTIPAAGAGPDLREMILGSEGRFGVLTEVDVRVSALPAHESFHAAFFADSPAAEAAVRDLAQSRVPLSMLRLYNAAETAAYLALAGKPELVRWLERGLRWRGCGAHKWWLTLGITGERAAARFALGQARAAIAAHRGVHAGTLLGRKWAEGRFKGPYLRNTLWELGYSVDTIETAVDWPRVQTTMAAMEATARDAFAADGVAVHAGAHLSPVYAQGCSVYSTFVWPTAAGGFEPNLQRWRRFKSRVAAAIAAQGGTVSHQHGVGRDHQAHLQVAARAPIVERQRLCGLVWGDAETGAELVARAKVIVNATGVWTDRLRGTLRRRRRRPRCAGAGRRLRPDRRDADAVARAAHRARRRAGRAPGRLAAAPHPAGPADGARRACRHAPAACAVPALARLERCTLG